MRHLIPLLAIGLGSSCGSSAPTSSGLPNVGASGHFTLKGVVNVDLPDDEIRLTTNDGKDVLAVTEMVDGKFEFQGKVGNSPVEASFDFSEHFMLIETIFLEPSDNMRIVIGPERNDGGGVAGPDASLTIKEVHGSRAHDDYVRLQAEVEEKFERKLYKLYMELENQMEISPEIEKLRQEHARYLETLIEQNPDDVKALFAVRMLMMHRLIPGSDAKSPTTMLASLSEGLRSSSFGEALAQEIEEEERVAAKQKELALGKKFKDFTLKDINGKSVTMSALLKPGKYYFLDFWASWCGPCRAENPNILRAYKQYHEQGFEVVGVSVDEETSPWTKAVEEDGMPWLQLIEIGGMEGEVAKDYGVSGVPTNFLLDSEGTIVARDLREEALHEKLAEVFGQGR